MSAASRPLSVVVLAAGQGTRMKSGLAKVLHPLCGRPMLHFPLAAAEALAPERIVAVVGRDAEQVEAAFAGRARFARQAELRGTGHAVLCAGGELEGFEGDVLVPDDFDMIRSREPSASGFRLPAEGVDLAALERELVEQALERTGGQQTRAAGLLGLTRDQIRYRIEKYELRSDPASDAE